MQRCQTATPKCIQIHPGLTYSIRVMWAKVQAIDIKFSQDLTHQKSLKLSELFEK